MGCGQSAPVYSTEDDASQQTVWKVIPEEVDLKRMFLLDNSVSPTCTGEMLEFRFLLDEPVAIAHLSCFAEKTSPQLAKQISLWKRLVAFKASNQCSLAPYCGLLVDTLAVAENQSLPQVAELRVLLNSQLHVASPLYCNSAQIVSKEDLQHLQRLLVELLYDELFVPFSTSDEHDRMRADLGKKFNNVGPDDFEYINVIAEGGFGLVLQGTRKSTGINYAIKVQPKAHLLRHFRRNPAHVMQEMQAHACCHHPFVTKLAYAFCTETLAVLVLPLAACGDLRRSLSLIPGGCMPFDRVQFYAAEIVSALCYLHSHGILYRDLKPGNILLNSDGHVLLSDFGSVADPESALCYDTDSVTESGMSVCNRGNPSSVNDDDLCVRSDSGSLMLNRGSASRRNLSHYYGHTAKPQTLPSSSIHSTTSQMGMLMQQAGSDGNSLQISTAKLTVSSNSRTRRSVGRDDFPGDVEDKSSNALSVLNMLSSKRRSKSLVGTLAYMAPEIIAMFGKKRKRKEIGEDPISSEDDPAEGYTNAVDWWSMGVTIYKLLTGLEPFRLVPYDKLHRYFPALVEKMGGLEPAFTAIFGTINFVYCDTLLTPAVVDIISQFLEIDADRRLGSDRVDENGELLGGGGVAEITKHPFFEGIDWEKLEKKQLKPPFDARQEATIAPSSYYSARNTNSSSMGRIPRTLPKILSMCNKANWLQRDPPAEQPAEALLKEPSACNSLLTASGAMQAREKIAALEQEGDGMDPIRIPASSILCAPPAKTPLASPSMHVAPELQEHFKGWSFVDPEVIALEARIAAIMAKL